MIKNIPFDSMPNLNETAKEFISLGRWGLYKKRGKFLLVIYNSPCCSSSSENKYYFLTEDGSFDKEVEEAFYLDKTGDESLEIIKFILPERITKHYFKVKI